MNEKIVEIKNLTFRYHEENILEHLNLNIYRGDFIGIIGANGTGKSTLMKLILGQLRADEGEILFHGIDKTGDIGYVPQLAIGSSYEFPITVFELVSLSLYEEIRGFHRIKKQHRDAVHFALEQVKMKPYRNHLYSQLSGGQRQRVLIAKALVNAPDFIILDEPTNGIDKESKKSLTALLSHLNRQHGITIVMITHDVEEIVTVTNHIYQMGNKTIQEVK